MKRIALIITALAAALATAALVFILMPDVTIEDNIWKYSHTETASGTTVSSIGITAENGTLTLMGFPEGTDTEYKYTEAETGHRTSIYTIESSESAGHAVVITTKEYKGDMVGQTAVVRTDDGSFGGSFSIPNRDGKILIVVIDGYTLYFTD